MKTLFSKQLKKIIEEKNISQKDLAVQAGITETTMSRYMNGSRIPKIDALINMAKCLDVSADLLLGLDAKTQKCDDNDDRLTKDLGEEFSPSRYALKSKNDCILQPYRTYELFYEITFKVIQKLGVYETIGTPEECRKAMEKVSNKMNHSEDLESQEFGTFADETAE